MTPDQGVLALGPHHISHIVKMHYFFKKPSSLFQSIDQTNQVCSNDDKGSDYQNCKFHDPWVNGSCARVWSYKSYSENALFL